MSRKTVALFAIGVFIFACKKPEQPPPPETVATTATTATTATVPEPQPDYKLDHFKFWKVQPSQFAETMELFGQCDTRPWKAGIGRVEYIGNPVDKKHNDNDKKHAGINGKVHYLAYRIVANEPQPKRKAVLSNQFTKEKATWLIDSPSYLLVPAGKTIEGEPEMQKGDHFVCYAVLEPKPIDVNISLEDQFDSRRYKREEIRQLTPKYFCVPVEKRRKGKEPEVPVNKETHLAIYTFNPDKLDKVLTVNTVDQLKKHKLSVIQSEWLAVPSTKYGKPEELPK